MSGIERGSDLTGTVLAGRYRIVQKLGEGAMGTVYLGEHLKIGRKDAIKVLRDGLATDAESIARFNRGARNVAAIRHPNVCMIYDYSDTGDGAQFLAMQFITGETLKDLVDREGILPLERAVSIARQTADGLQAAHEVGIVHRDLKPGNIMVSPGRKGEDVVTVVDFDIAKGSAEGEESEVTRLGFVVGTPEYMSPEQLTGDRLDGRSDTYSLGLVFFRMVTGTLPFAGTTAQDMMIQRLTTEPLRLDQVLPGVAFPPGMQEALDRALSRDVKGRQAEVAEFGRELVESLAGTSRAGSAGGLAGARGHTTSGGGDVVPQTRISRPLAHPTVVEGVFDGAGARAAGAGAGTVAAGEPRKPWIGNMPAIAAAAVAVVALLGVGIYAMTRPGDEGIAEPLTQSPPDFVDVGGIGGSVIFDPIGGESTAAEAPSPTGLGGAPANTGGGAPASSGGAPPVGQQAQSPPPPPAVRVPLGEVSATLFRQLDRLGPPDPPRAALAGIRDTVDAVYGLSGVATNDRAMAAYIAGNAELALGSPSGCVMWLDRALQLRPDGPGYRDMLDGCRSQSR